MTALICLDPSLCPECSTSLDSLVQDEPALLRHGGYGATRRTTFGRCGGCGWVILASVEEVRP